MGVFEDFRDLYYTDKNVAITGLVQAGIDKPKIDFLIASVTATAAGKGKQSVPKVQTNVPLPNIPLQQNVPIQSLSSTINKIPNPIVSGP